MKSIKHRLLSLLLTLVTVLSLLPTAAFAASNTGSGLKITTNQAYWSTRLLANGTPYSYRPPLVDGKLVYCMDSGLGYHYATPSYLNSFTWTSGTGADDPLPEYYGTAVSVAIWVFSLWVLKRIRNFYIAGKETTTIEKKFDFVAFFVCFPVVTYLAPQISSYQIDGVTSGCFGIQLVWCLKLLYIQFHDPEGNTPE